MRLLKCTPLVFAAGAWLALSPSTPALANCSFSGYKYAYEYTTDSYRGIGGYIYSTQSSIQSNSDHVVYSFADIPPSGYCSYLYEEVGRVLGYTLGYTFTSPTIFTFNPNPYMNGNGTDCSSGLNSSAFHSYGAAPSNEGYWTYPNGYYVWGLYGEGREYEYRFDYGSLGNHAPNNGWSTTSSNNPETNSEVYQGLLTVPCESMDAYWGANNGTPSSADAISLSNSLSDTPSFSSWGGGVTTTIWQDPIGYNWTVLNDDNYWAVHSHGSPS